MKTTTKLDLHLHTRGSDGMSSAEDIVKAALKAGLDGFAITDHHRTATAEGLKVAELARKAGLLVFRGCEYSTADGHCLVFGCDVAELGLGMYPAMQDVVTAVNKAGGVAVPAHPYHGYKHKLGDKVKSLKGIPAVEVANGQVATRTPSENAEALAAAKERRARRTGGSDAHYASMVGVCFTEFASLVKTERELVRALRHGHYEAVTDTARTAAFQKAALDSAKPARQARGNGTAPANPRTAPRWPSFWDDETGSVFNR